MSISQPSVGCMDRYATNRYIMSQNHGHHMQPHHQPSYYCPTQQQQQQQQQQQHISLSHPQHTYMMGCYTQSPNGWAGIPLISTAARRPRKNNFNNNNNCGNTKHRILVSNNTSEFDENAMSRLAIHAHGAPLILAGRYRNRMQKRDNNKQLNGSASKNKGTTTLDITNRSISSNLNDTTTTPKSNATTVTTTDSISVTSDESSNGGTTPEASLPRIIKPRKRRKKDRKPPPNNICLPENASSQHGSNEPDGSHIVTHYGIDINEFTIHNNNDLLFNIDASKHGRNLNVLSEYPQKEEATSDNLSKMQLPEEDETVGTCCCRLCDPSCRIWAFPLRRSCSDNSAEIEIQRGKDVGVIGSNRSWSSKNDWRSISKIDQQQQQQQQQQQNHSSFRNGSFSDSGDSGCDILSGINFGEDLFYTSSSLSTNSSFSSSSSSSTSLSNNSSNPISPEILTIDDRNFIDFPAAESLLTESINEISKKLMETVDLRSDIFSSDSSSVFSDSVLSDDVLYNLENLTKGGTTYFCGNSSSNSNSGGGCGDNTLFDHDTNQLINNNNHNLFGSDNSNFVMFHEKDRENEILNCFDMVWNGSNKLLPIEERIQLQSSG